MSFAFWVVGLAFLLAFYFYCRLFLRLSLAETLRRIFGVFRAFLHTAQSAKSWDEIISIAYETWLTHSYPAGRCLAAAEPTVQQIEQAGLLLKALVASDLKRPDLPERVRRGHQEILRMDPVDLGYAVRDLILEQWVMYGRGDSAGD